MRSTPPGSGTLLLYVLDIYDPWSYAYLPSVSGVLSAASWVVDVEVVHARRYDGGDASWLATAVQQASSPGGPSASTPVFGRGFLDAVAGGLRVDPVAGAAGTIALLAAEQVPAHRVLGAVQHAFFQDGRPLEAPGALRSVAEALGLDADAVELFAGSDRARELAVEDFEIARDLVGTGGPLLMASSGERLFEFDGLGATSEHLVDQFRTVLTSH